MRFCQSAGEGSRLQSMVASVAHPEPLSNALLTAGCAAPARYKCLVRLLDHFPANVAEFCQPAGEHINAFQVAYSIP